MPATSFRPTLIASILLLNAFTRCSDAESEAHRKGVALYKAQEFADAIATLEEAVKSEPTNKNEYAESALLIGQSYFLLQQAAKAIPWLEKVTKVNEANYMLGYAYLQTGKPDRSVAAFTRLFGLKPNTAGAHVVAAQMMLKEEWEEPAMAEARRALGLDPTIPRAHFLLAEVAIYRGRFEEGIDELKAELEIDPNFSNAWYRLGDAYVRRQEYGLAIPNLQRAVWLNPDYSGPYILLGKCYFRGHNYSDAEDILRGALRVDPQNRQATYLLGQVLMAAGRKEEAVTILKRFLTNDDHPH